MIGKSYQSINPMNHSSDICAENRKALGALASWQQGGADWVRMGHPIA